METAALVLGIMFASVGLPLVLVWFFCRPPKESPPVNVKPPALPALPETVVFVRPAEGYTDKREHSEIEFSGEISCVEENSLENPAVFGTKTEQIPNEGTANSLAEKLKDMEAHNFQVQNMIQALAKNRGQDLSLYSFYEKLKDRKKYSLLNFRNHTRDWTYDMEDRGPLSLVPHKFWDTYTFYPMLPIYEVSYFTYAAGQGGKTDRETNMQICGQIGFPHEGFMFHTVLIEFLRSSKNVPYSSIELLLSQGMVGFIRGCSYLFNEPLSMFAPLDAGCEEPTRFFRVGPLTSLSATESFQARLSFKSSVMVPDETGVRITLPGMYVERFLEKRKRGF